MQESKQVQLSSWKNIIYLAREKGEIDSPMSGGQIANMFINSSSGVEMQNKMHWATHGQIAAEKFIAQ